MDHMFTRKHSDIIYGHVLLLLKYSWLLVNQACINYILNMNDYFHDFDVIYHKLPCNINYTDTVLTIYLVSKLDNSIQCSSGIFTCMHRGIDSQNIDLDTFWP